MSIKNFDLNADSDLYTENSADETDPRNEIWNTDQVSLWKKTFLQHYVY